VGGASVIAEVFLVAWCAVNFVQGPIPPHKISYGAHPDQAATSTPTNLNQFHNGNHANSDTSDCRGGGGDQSWSLGSTELL